MAKKLINFDDLAEDPQSELKEALNTDDPNQYKWMWRACICGPSGSGKSSYLCNILLNSGLKYDRVWVCARDQSDPKYLFLAKYYQKKAINIAEDIKKQLNKKVAVPILFRVFKDVSEIPPLNDALKQENVGTILVIDDFINDRPTDTWLKNSIHVMRHYNVSLFYLCQSFFQVAKFIRLNFDYISFFDFGDNRIIMELMKSFSLGDPKNPKDRAKFIQYYKKGISEDFKPFTMDLTYRSTKNPLLKFRQGMEPITLQEEPA